MANNFTNRFYAALREKEKPRSSSPIAERESAYAPSAAANGAGTKSDYTSSFYKALREKGSETGNRIAPSTARAEATKPAATSTGNFASSYLNRREDGWRRQDKTALSQMQQKREAAAPPTEKKPTLSDIYKDLDASKARVDAAEKEIDDYLAAYGATADDFYDKLAAKYGATPDDNGEYIFGDKAAYDAYSAEAASLGLLYDRYNTEAKAYNGYLSQAQNYRSADTVSGEIAVLEKRRDNLRRERSKLTHNQGLSYDHESVKKISDEISEIDAQLKPLKKEHDALEKEEEQYLIDTGEYRKAGAKDILWNSLKRGWYNAKYGEASYDDMSDNSDEAKQARRYQQEIGQFGAGNIDLYARGEVSNPDGTYSTVASFSKWDDRIGKEVLVPAVIQVNGEWKRVSENEAWEHYMQTGEYLGVFDTPQEADEYAEKLHIAQDYYYRGTKKKKYADILSGDDYNFVTDGWLEDAISGGAEQVGLMAQTFFNPYTVASAASLAAAAAIAGNAGPQIALPEEAVTVPAAFTAGLGIGTTKSIYEIEAGLAYEEMIENGISDKTAQIAANLVGGVNAIIEVAQLDELIDAYKILNGSRATQEFATKLAVELLDRGINVLTETGEEELQELATITGTQIAGYIDNGELVYSSGDILDRLGDTGKSSVLAFGAMNVPAIASNIAFDAAGRASQSASKAIEGDIAKLDGAELLDEQKSPPVQGAEQSRQRVGGSVAPLGVSATQESTNSIAPTETKSKTDLSNRQREDVTQYVTEQNMDDVVREVDAGTLAVDALGRIYRPDESEHIDQRSSYNVGARSVNAFQFDHPEVQPYFREAAADLMEELNAAEKGGQIIHAEARGVGDDLSLRTKRFASDRIVELLDKEHISYSNIERALNAIINDEGQENFAAAKRVELMLDNMLTNGYRNAYGEYVAPNEAYIAAKQAIPGAVRTENADFVLPLHIGDFASDEEAQRRVTQVRDAAATLGINGSRALSAAYTKGVASTYPAEEAVEDFFKVYNAALNGKKSDDIVAPDFVRVAAQNAGERDARVASQAKYFGEKSGLVRDENWKKAKLTSKESYMLDALGKVTGTEIRFAESVADGQANAEYSDGVITIALDAKDPTKVSAVHETVHRIREASPEAYEEIASFVQEHMSDESMGVNLAVRKKLYKTSDTDYLTEEIVADAFGTMLERSDVLEQFVTEHRSAAQKILDALHDLLLKIRRALGSKEVTLSDNQRAAFRDLAGKTQEMEKLFADALETMQGKENAATKGGEAKYSVKNIVGDSGKQYGIGVYLDNDLLTGLSDTERKQMVKLRVVEELAGNSFIAYDNGNPVEISISRKNEKIRNNSGNRVPVLKELYDKYIGNEIKQEAVVLADELIEASKHNRTEASSHSHDWLDNYGKNNWEKRTVYLQDKNKTVWEATLQIANSADGRKILYDIDPIKMTEGAIKLAPTTANNNVPQNAGGVKKKYSLKEYTPEERVQHEKDAISHFGKTFRWNETGYLTPNGTKIDFSGRHDGGPGGYRTVDHRDIREALGDDYGGDDYSGSMVQFMSEGNIRISPESGGINLSVAPTKAQQTALSDFISKNRGEVILDIDTPDGQTVVSVEYPRGTHADKVLGDIKAYFEDGTMPQVSELAKFRYSLKTDSDGRKRFSLKAFEDGTRFVDVQTDQKEFDGLSDAQKSKKATQIIKEKFAGRVIGLDNRVFVNGRSASEYGYPVKRLVPELVNAKMRASTELDNLIDAGANFRTKPDGEDGHTHPDAVGDFRYFDTIFKVGDEYYKGVINIKPVAKGLLLKDITKIENITQDLYSSYGTNPKSVFLRDASMNSIDGSKGGVKKKFSSKTDSDGRELTEDTDIRRSRSTREVLDEYVEQYGEIKAGEKPYRTIKLPKRTAEDKYVSQTIRTVLEAKATPEAMVPTLEDMVADGKFSYDRYTDKQAVSDAESKIRAQGWEKVLNQWKKRTKNEVSKEAMATGWALYNNAAAGGDVETALEVLEDIVAKSRNAAQALQAVRILKQQEPSTQLYGVERSVENLQEELNERYGKDAPELKVNRELAEKFLNAKTDKARTEAMAELYRDIGRQMPSRFIDKWNAWRYLAMLGNPRTHVRNIAGNAGFVPLVTVKNVVGAWIEQAANAATGGKVGRTKSILTPKDSELIKAAWNDYANVASEVLGEGKYNESAAAKKEIEEGRIIFKTKPLEKFRRFNSAALDREDAWFSRPHYAAALAQYCKANGLTSERIARGAGLENARNYAIKEAQKATYRDTNAFSQMVSRMGRVNRGSKNSAEKVGSAILEGVLPFRKTPANILVRGVEYSPIELMKSITYDLYQVQRGKMEATEMIDHLSTGLTGTGVLVLGAYLAKEGLLRGSGGDDEEKKKDFDELRGHQDYSIELPDGTSVTLDWLAPEVLPLFVGVNLYEEMQSEADGLTMADLLEAVSNVSDPLLQMSCLQSLNDLFDSVGYAASGDTSALASVAASAATSYLTQAVPTLLGQIERTGEGERMTSYTDKNKWLTGDTQYFLGRASSRIPGVDYGQIPYIDAWGRTESTGGIGERAFNNFLNPAYTSTVESGAMEDELERLYEATGETGVLPERAGRYFNVGGERKDLTGEEYVKYATARGQNAYRIVSGITSSSAYRALDDSDKVAVIEEAYKVANAEAKMAVSAYKPDGKTEKAINAKKAGVDEAQFILLYQQQGSIESLKDSKGKTIDLSQGLLKMELVYQQKGLSDAQRAALFEAFNVPESIRHYNKALVEQKLKAMRQSKSGSNSIFGDGVFGDSIFGNSLFGDSLF